MLNRIVLVGRLVADPILKKTQESISVTSFTIAVNRGYTSKDGSEEADFIDCVAWRNQADNLVKFMRKGSLIGLEGRLRKRKYLNQQGENRYVVEVVADNISFLESKSSRENMQNQSNFNGNSLSDTNINDYSSLPDSDEDIPF